MKYVVLALCLFGSLCQAAEVKVDSLVLMQPDEALRTKGLDVKEFADYAKVAEERFTAFIKPMKLPKTQGFVVLAVREGGVSNAWLDLSPALPKNVEAKLVRSLRSIKPFHVSNGTALFALKVMINGAEPSTEHMPFPKVWREAIRGKEESVEVEDLVEMVWPYTRARRAPRPPREFVTQNLDPVGGKIERPKDWFYSENHGERAYRWTLTREDATGNKPYTTGVRIQMFVGVKEETGKTAEEFIRNFLAAKKNEAKVLKDCDAENQGLFTRICLETEEGPYHILYSLFWGNDDRDVAVVVISGTSKELWSTFAPTFDRMSHFQLMDLQHAE